MIGPRGAASFTLPPVARSPWPFASHRLYHLRTLGKLDLRAPDGSRADAVLAQPRRAALLACLVLARPRGPVRRDALLARFWPDAAEPRGRAALRNALSFLRRALPGVLEARADDAVEVSAGALRCDVWEMEAALERGDDAGAVALYGGELLAGFHAGGAPEWESWLEAERRRLARAASSAAARLAAAAEAAGDAAGELRWRRAALEIDPHDEVALRALLLALDAAGDRAGALGAYEAFARGVRRAYDAEPANETVVLIRAIRARRPADAVPGPADATDAAEADPAASPPRRLASPGGSATADRSASGDRSASPGQPGPAGRSAPGRSTSPDRSAPAGRSASGDRSASPEALSHPADSAASAASRQDTTSATGAADRAGVSADVDRPGDVDALGASESTETGDSSAAPIATRRRSSRRRWGWAAVAVMAMAAIFLAVARRGATGATGVPTRVAVLPFAVRSAPSHAYLAEGMTDLLSVRLDGTGELTTVDPFALLGFLRSTGDPSGMEAGRLAARRFGAGRFVLGSVLEAGGRLHVQAALYDAAGRRRATAEVADLREDSLFAAVDLLVRQLVAGQMGGAPRALDRTAALTTTSLPALKDYLAGQRDFRRGRFAEASERFTRAGAADTAFALAHYRLSVAQDWGSEDGSAAARRALRLAHRLSAADRMLLQARVAFRTGSAARAEALCRALLASHPDHVEARNELGEILFHRAMWQGRSLAVSRPEWRGVLGLDSASIPARVHLAGVAALEGRGAELDTLVRGIARLSPEHESLRRLRLLRAVSLGDRAGEAAVLRELRAADQAPHDPREDLPWGAAWRTADFLEDPAAGLRVAEMMTAPHRTPRARLLGFTTRAHLRMALGQWRAARAETQAGARIDPAYAARTWAFLAATAPFPLPRAELARARDALARTAPPRADGTGDVVDHERAAFPIARHHYLLGALSASLGDSAGVARALAALAAPGDTGAAAAGFAAHLRHQLLARDLRARGKTAEALAQVERGWPEPVAALFMKDDSYSTVAERYLRAELLEARGRDAEALRWYGSLAEDISRGLVFPTAAHLGRARVLERLGRPAAAAAEYERHLRRWSAADPEARTGVDAARTRLAALRPPK